MPPSSTSGRACEICGDNRATLPTNDPVICPRCYERSEELFQEEMRRVEMIRTVRGRDVEVYDIKHPESRAPKHHCGQVILIRAGQGFEVKICLRSDSVDWMSNLSDATGVFISRDRRLDALIGNVTLLIESWGGGPHYMDIFYVNKVVSTEGEI
ncbi:MAG: hypothetical protein FJ118_18945 [Deltaproteobacteria bacterium]|nr:hypothetical protein [Deltaproteobacteria bacterium]